MALADRFDGLLIDFDGVVWRGREPIPGSPETLAALLAAGKRLAFVTNNPSRPPASYAERLREIGVEAEPAQIVTAGMTAAHLAAATAGTGEALVLGREALRELVAAAGPRVLDPADVVGAERAAVVVVSGFRDFNYTHLRAAKRALDAGAALVATSRDPTMPMPGGDWPGSGAVLAAVEVASGRTAEIAGKPERHLFDLALAQLGCSFRSDSDQKEQPKGDAPFNRSFCPDSSQKEQLSGRRVAMVGDRLASDIEGGRRAGLETVLVLSGSTSRAEAEAAASPPDHVIEDLAGLLR